MMSDRTVTAHSLGTVIQRNGLFIQKKFFLPHISHYCSPNLRERDNVIIVISVEADRSEVRILAGARDFYLLRKANNPLWGLSIFLLSGYWGYFEGKMRLLLKVDHPHRVPKIWTSGAIPLLLHTPSWRGHGQLGLFLISKWVGERPNFRKALYAECFILTL